jgi:hypothetical protein
MATGFVRSIRARFARIPGVHSAPATIARSRSIVCTSPIQDEFARDPKNVSARSALAETFWLSRANYIGVATRLRIGVAAVDAIALLTATGAAAGLRLPRRGAGRDIDSLDD